MINIIESGDQSCNSQIAILLAAIARIMCDCKIGWVVRSIDRDGDDVINVDRIFVKQQVNGLSADEAIARLTLVKLMEESGPVLLGQSVKVKGWH